MAESCSFSNTNRAESVHIFRRLKSQGITKTLDSPVNPRHDAYMVRYTLLIGILCFMTNASPESERQLTFSPHHHDLDGTQNFSPDDRFLCYDTRDTVGEGIGNSQTIEMVELATGRETVLYRPEHAIVGKAPAPGVGAPFFHPLANRVAFIHGPPAGSERGPYGITNRTGYEVEADGSMRVRRLDLRDVATERDTIPGAHRGGTHVHQYSGDGRRIGVTYDDYLMPQYRRTIAYLEEHAAAPAGYSRYFAVLIRTVPEGTSTPGEFERAASDSWVGAGGTQRAFVGTVRAANGVDYEQALFVVEIPEDTDITTADSGGPDRFPAPPRGLRVRRVTQSAEDGFVRASPDGTRIAYYDLDAVGRIQIFIVPIGADPSTAPMQATHFERGVDRNSPSRIEGGLRWHPDGNVIICLSEGAIAAVSVEPGPRFGETRFLTPRDEHARLKPVWSHNGRTIAYNRRVPTLDPQGNPVRAYDGRDFLQIFTLSYANPFE
jgi:hypothetical protein